MPLDKIFLSYTKIGSRGFLSKWKPNNKSALILKQLLESVKYINFNKIRNRILVDALFKSDARSDGKQEIFYMAFKYWNAVCLVTPVVRIIDGI